MKSSYHDVMADTQIHQFPLRLPADVFATLRAEASATSESVNGLLLRIINEHLQDHREDLIESIGRAAQTRYAVALKKLENL